MGDTTERDGGMERKLVYRIDEVADLLGAHKQTVSKYISDGKLEASAPGESDRATRYISRADLEAFYREYGGGRLFPDEGGGVEPTGETIVLDCAEQGTGYNFSVAPQSRDRQADGRMSMFVSAATDEGYDDLREVDVRASARVITDAVPGDCVVVRDPTDGDVITTVRVGEG